MKTWLVTIAPVEEASPILGFNVSVTPPDDRSYGRVMMSEDAALRWAATELEKAAHRIHYHSVKV